MSTYAGPSRSQQYGAVSPWPLLRDTPGGSVARPASVPAGASCASAVVVGRVRAGKPSSRAADPGALSSSCATFLRSDTMRGMTEAVGVPMPDPPAEAASIEAVARSVTYAREPPVPGHVDATTTVRIDPDARFSGNGPAPPSRTTSTAPALKPPGTTSTPATSALSVAHCFATAPTTPGQYAIIGGVAHTEKPRRCDCEDTSMQVVSGKAGALALASTMPLATRCGEV